MVHSSTLCLLALSTMSCLVNISYAFSMVRSRIIRIAPMNRCDALSGSKDDNNNNKEKGGFWKVLSDFWTELDNFMDDASARRLGNGAAFYGKRKSNFYGKNDKNKKSNAIISDPMEDYQAPSDGGYFQWMPDENGELRPVTRMKKRIVEKRNPTSWDPFWKGSVEDEE